MPQTLRAALLATGVACAALAACGDDGTEGLSSCPDSKIVLNKDNQLVCAPPEKKAGAAGEAAKASTTTAASSQANTTAGAANSGSANLDRN